MKKTLGLTLSCMLAMLTCGCGKTFSLGSSAEYTDHPLVDACYSDRPGSIPLALRRGKPNVVDDRFYMKNHSFSVYLPEVFRNGYIDEDASEPLSIAMFRDASGENMVMINVTQTMRYECSPEAWLMISKQAFPRWISVIQNQNGAARVLHESEWQSRARAGYFGLMELPGGVTRQDSGDEDVIRGYLVSFIDDCIIHITVQDSHVSFKSGGVYQPIDTIRAELLRQATLLLESLRCEQNAPFDPDL